MASAPQSKDLSERARKTTPEPGPASGPIVVEGPLPNPGLGWRILGVFLTMRPHQWVKNVFVLAPVVFAKEVFEQSLLERAAAAFAIFCMLAGAVYTINDMADVAQDRSHPVKRHRPIPSGRVPISWARALAVVLVTGSLSGAALLGPWFFAVALAYFVLNLAYSFKLKHAAYLDVVCIAAGFVLRVTAGGLATQIQISAYLLLCTALLALFLGLGKRRHELTAAATRARKQRASLESYSKVGLDIALAITATLTVGTYIAYTLDTHTREFFQNDWLWPSALFVILGVLRFLHIVRFRPEAESPTQEMLKDGPFVAIVLLWVMLVMWVVYNLRPAF
jgi:4-hydroxybenzoate polyprenyltransferase